MLVLTMPDPSPVAVVGDLLATQALDQGVAAMLVDAAVRDLDELRELGLPIWARYVRAQGATKEHVGELDTRVVVGGAEIDPGDLVVLDADGAVVVKADRVDEVVGAAPRARGARARAPAPVRGGRALLRRQRPPPARRRVTPARRGARPRRGGRDDRGRARRRGVRRAGLGPGRPDRPAATSDARRRPTEAVAGADLVLSLATAAHAVEAAASVALVAHRGTALRRPQHDRSRAQARGGRRGRPHGRGVHGRGAPRDRARAGRPDARARVGRRRRAVRRARSRRSGCRSRSSAASRATRPG